MSSDIQSTFIEAATADPDGISTAASVGNNAALVIGGALTSVVVLLLTNLETSLY